MGYIAHIREKDKKIQSVQQHLHEVRILSEQFGSKIGMKHLAGLAGLLHDLGKNSEEFKAYIQEAALNPDHPPPRGSVDHSTAGGKFIFQQFHGKGRSGLEQLAAEWISMCILSHHGGLRDYVSPDISSPYLERVIQKKIPEFDHTVSVFLKQQMARIELENYFNEAVCEMKAINDCISQQKLQAITLSHILKYIFSCLIDADRTNTRIFEEGEQEELILDRESFFNRSYAALMRKVNSFREGKDADHPINILRSEMSDQCEAFASNPSGIYTLSIPTGGGKTLASLRYALKHAIQYRKDRIIYIVPYTTIIEQNAEEIRTILENDTDILEHHSNVIEDQIDEDETYDFQKKKLKLAKDNWDSPIIFTTMVQFLNVFYAKGTRNIRRLHNLANAILIFDEVQSVPIKCISLFNGALNFLSSFGKSSIVLCTATQPALDFVQHKLNISAGAEMIHNLKFVSESFKRVNIEDKTTSRGWNATELKAFVLDEMEKIDRLLVILNTKTAVRKLFAELSLDKEEHGFKLYHLSTSMCPAHRKKILLEVKEAIKNRERVICVSTQLIEAGVDISFQCVVRSLAGLDSIAQAAGRCNRHGKDGTCNVYIIKSADEKLSKLKEIKTGAEQTARILVEFHRKPEAFGDDLLSPAAMTTYFEYYYTQIAGDLNYRISELEKDMFDLLSLNPDYFTAFKRKSAALLHNRQSFATAEKHFHVIDNPTTSVLVPYNDDAREIILDLNGDLDSMQLTTKLKEAQQYVINIYKQDFDRLDRDQNIDLLLHGNIYALKEVAYTEEVGLDLEGEGDWTTEMI